MNQRSLAVLFLITAAGLALRLSGVGFLLPQMTESDSRVIHEQVEHLERGDEHPERDRSFGFYPLLIARVTACVFDDAPPKTPAVDLEEHLRRASASHEHVRIVGTILSVLLIPATWLLARWFLSAGASLLAAAFAAGSTLNLFGHQVFLNQFRGAGFAKLYATLRDYDPWISALAVVGALFASRPRLPEKWKDLAVILAHAVPYAIAVGLYARTYQRFAMPLVPYLCLLAAYAAQRIANPLPAVARGGVFVLALAPQAWLSIRLAIVRGEPDTIQRAAQWVADHVNAEDKIVVLPSLQIPLPLP